MDQLAEAATKINKLITKLEQTKQQLERAQKEIKELKDAAQVATAGSRKHCVMLQPSRVMFQPSHKHCGVLCMRHVPTSKAESAYAFSC
jgi:DNA repair exonuclease SbcCD ATPase subunit